MREKQSELNIFQNVPNKKKNNSLDKLNLIEGRIYIQQIGESGAQPNSFWLSQFV